jgi:hypothetical protein
MGSGRLLISLFMPSDTERTKTIKPLPSFAQITSEFSPHLSRLLSDLKATACITVGYISALIQDRLGRAYTNIPHSNRIFGERDEEIASFARTNRLNIVALT